jgi:general secretion pathway protein A
MEYFKILNLIREPFSNSPEPEFFFQSAKHVSCLQQLELAIRLRRGLNVVMGHVGTGKTTLCRHLITQFMDKNGEADAVETHLLMDPAFSTPLEFLSTVAVSFGIAGKRKRRVPADQDLSEWQLKENIKDYLFKEGVDERKIVVLIIDEGQKLPDFCLEILREFLNYETNENKLLQIVIFCQPEFQQILNRLENVSDRVNLIYMLEPLNYRETREMIRFRLTQAGEPGYTPALFTRPGLLAVYLATGGYPRKVITLCHQVILALIIQNRCKAGWFLVRSCAARLASAGKTWRARALRWTPGMLVAFAALLIIFIVRPVTIDSVKTPDPPRQEIAQHSTAVQEPVRYEKPDLLGKLVLKNGRTIWWMLTDFYGDYNESIFRSVALANPHIKNLSRVQAGEIIHLPALPAEKSPFTGKRYWVQIAASTNLEETYELYRTYKSALSSLLFLPYWNPRQGMVFSIVLTDGSPDETTARQRITRLPSALAPGAGVMTNPEQDTVFYTRKRTYES